MSLGSDLRQHRLQLGVTLAQIADITKLPLRQLELLEDDALTQLPGGIFRRGLVRAYCTCLQLEPESWLERLNALDAEGDEPDWTTFARNVQRNRPGAGRRLDLRWAGVLALLLALGGSGWALWVFFLRGRLGH